jgi:sugar lactone lactonase YvrE
LALALLPVLPAAVAVAGIIDTVAGMGAPGFSGDGGLATSAQVIEPRGIALDARGDLFIADPYTHRIRRVEAGTGVVTTVAGTRTPGFSGDGGPATEAQLAYPTGVAVDGRGDLFIADYLNHRIRRVAAGTGVITTAAGTGLRGLRGDSGPATSAELAFPIGVAVDATGNLFIADSGNDQVRRVAGDSGIITTAAGHVLRGFAGDGGPATTARLGSPYAVALDARGNLYIADTFNYRVRKVDAVTGIVTTVAGTGVPGFGGDGGPATSARLNRPVGVALDGAGNLFIADEGNHRVRKVAAETGLITTVAGTGTASFGGDGGPATSAPLFYPGGVAVDATGNLFIADRGNARVRRVFVAVPPGPSITTVAGVGTAGPAGDGGLARDAQLDLPRAVVPDSGGDLLIVDQGNQSIRRVAAGTGRITTVAGTGAFGFGGDGGPAAGAQLGAPLGIALDAAGNVFIADTYNHRIRRLAAGTAQITTVAGSGPTGLRQGGFAGDGGPATGARLNSPAGVALDASGNLFVADTGNSRVRRVDARSGLITTVAGTGTTGFSGDGGAAIGAQLDEPRGIAVDRAGNLFIADTFNHRIRKVAAGTGVISTMAGTGMAGFSGDGGPATGAQLNQPGGIAVDPSGNLFIADSLNHRVRRVAAAMGFIDTVAGVGVAGFRGDGAPATTARLNAPSGVALDPNGNLYIADQGNHRIRMVPGAAAPVRPILTMPIEGTRLLRGSPTPVTFSWTNVAGAARYGFEHTGPNRQFANPNGTGPDPANGFGGMGGGFVVPGTSFPITLTPSVPAGAYQVRVIGLSPGGQVIGCFSDAVTVVVP